MVNELANLNFGGFRWLTGTIRIWVKLPPPFIISLWVIGGYHELLGGLCSWAYEAIFFILCSCFTDGTSIFFLFEMGSIRKKYLLEILT